MKKFFVLWSSQAASLLGSAVVEFALAWYLTRETGSATVLATAIMAALLPVFALGPFAGPLVDRWDRKKMLIFADLFTMALTVVLVVLFATGAVTIWHVYLIMVGRSIGETFQFPALGASIPMLVPEQHLVRANGFFQMLRNAVKVVAPVTGAFLMELLPMQAVLFVDIVTAVIAVGCLLPLMIPRPPITMLSARTHYLQDMKQSFSYVRSRRGLVMLFGMMAALFFFVAPAASLIPVLVFENLGGEVVKLGWLTAASGIGGVAGGLLLGVWGGFKKRMGTSLFGFAVMIPCSVVLGLTSPAMFYLTTVPAMVCMGAAGAIASAPLTAIMNLVIDRDMQGRVFSIQGSLVMGSMLLGLVFGGPLADALGIRSLYFIASGAWFVVLSLAMLSKSLLDLENHPVGTVKAEISPTGTSP